MLNIWFRTHLRVLLVFFAFLMFLTGIVLASTHSATRTPGLTGKAVGQTQERLLKKSTFPNEPMKIVKIIVKQKAIEANKKFSEEDDWLKSLTITLKNVSDKPIVFIEVSLNFPAVEEHPDGPEPGYVRDLTYGRQRPPDAPVLSDQSKPVMPNENVDISLTVEDQEAIEAALIRLGFPLHTKSVKMSLRTVIFNDDTMWRAGRILIRDTGEPGSWNVVRPAQGSSSKNDPRHEYNSLNRSNSAYILVHVKNETTTRRMAHVTTPQYKGVAKLNLTVRLISLARLRQDARYPRIYLFLVWLGESWFPSHLRIAETPVVSYVKRAFSRFNN